MQGASCFLVKGIEIFKTMAENTEFIHLAAPGRFFVIVN